MQSFIAQSWNHLSTSLDSTSNLKCIVPSVRAGNFLRKTIQKTATQAGFMPAILTIEDFIKEVADLAIIGETPLLFEFYQVYLVHTPESQQETFDNFASWAITLIADFNELDRYLVPTESFFSYLYSIQELNHWTNTSQQTTLIKNYLAFWKQLPELYTQLYNALKTRGVGYQGMIYREAAEAIEYYAQANRESAHAFIGFNALNNAEQQIIQELLELPNTLVYWDADAHFTNDKFHSASFFMRGYFEQWPYYKKNEPLFIGDNYTNQHKNISITQAPNAVGQVKHIGNILANLAPEALNNTAVVLADEALLVPLLNSLPPSVQQVNVTMGVSLGTIPLMQWIQALLQVQPDLQGNIYYKQVFNVLGHPAGQHLLANGQDLITRITKENQITIPLSYLQTSLNAEETTIITQLFSPWSENILASIERLQVLVSYFLEDTNLLRRTAATQLVGVLEVIAGMQARFNSINSVASLLGVINQLASRERLNYRGDAYSGLQIMGVLESRALDFDTLIMASVNEGVIPSGKSANSFITSDLKKQYGLPSFYQKDAIFTYHFYRSLHRAKEVHLLYTAVGNGLQTSEMSRLIKQLIHEDSPHTITQNILEPELDTPVFKLREVAKNKDIAERLKALAIKGFSPSALTSYIRNPFDFYTQKVLGVRQSDQIEEDIAYNTLGSIVHEVLEELYKPVVNQFLSNDLLDQMKPKISTLLSEKANNLLGSHYLKGKNRIVFEVAKQYVLNAIALDKKHINAGDRIQIIAIEGHYSSSIAINKLADPVKIHGIIDRVDLVNDQLRVLDYKTGAVDPGQLRIADWELLPEDYKYSKAFQVLMYSLLFKDSQGKLPDTAGIVSFKKMGNGFMPFGLQASGRTYNYSITQEVLADFKSTLITVLDEIYDTKQPLIEKEV